MTRVMVASILMRTWMEGARGVFEGVADRVARDGRLVRLDALPPYAPVSTYFFALSHAPPALLRKSERRMPVTVETMRRPASTIGAEQRLTLQRADDAEDEADEDRQRERERARPIISSAPIARRWTRSARSRASASRP